MTVNREGAVAGVTQVLEIKVGGYVADALRLAFPASWVGARLVVILTAYFDESGTHRGAKALSVGGYVSTADHWELFEREWMESLRIYGVDYFHTTDFVASQGEFKKWPRQHQHHRLRRLIDTGNRHSRAAIGVAIPVSLYESLPHEDRAACGSIYRVAAMQCCMEVTRWMKEKHADGEVAYVFEAGAKGKGIVTEFFTRVMQDKENRERFRVLSIRFEDKRRFVVGDFASSDS